MPVRSWSRVCRRTFNTGKLAASALIALCALESTASAQVRRDANVEWHAGAGSDSERYLRALQLVGIVPLHPWTIRAFSPLELRTLTPATGAHPWAAALSRPHKSGSTFQILSPEAEAIGNSGFAYGANDGPLWAGRGLTTSLRLGVRGTLGPLDVTIAPQVFRAENAAFTLAPNGETGDLAFANGVAPRVIDLPQRFGAAPYQRADAGESSIRLTFAGMSAGVSSASEWWGPAVENPHLLGSNAGGFPHLFVGSSKPWTLGPVRVHGRLIGGSLQHSDYAFGVTPDSRRTIGGLIGSLGFTRLPGLEIGVGRILQYNVTDSTGGIADVLGELLKSPLKERRRIALGDPTADEPDNQLASAFFRWVFPPSGVELYGEFGREDNSFDLRDLIVEPDHISTYLLGLGRGWKRPGNRIVVLRAEVMNSRVTHLNLVRGQGRPYVHTVVVQGHTQRGQALAAPDGFGGGGASLSIEDLSERGRRSLRLSRSLRAEELPSQLQGLARPADVIYALGGEWMTFHGRVDVTRELVGVYNLNRGFRDNAVNIRAAVRARAHW